MKKTPGTQWTSATLSFSSVSFSWLSPGSLLTTPAARLAQSPLRPSRPSPSGSLTSCRPGSLGTCLAPLGPRHLLARFHSYPLAPSPTWAAGCLLERGPADGSEVGSEVPEASRRQREEDAAPLRCHRRVAGKQLVPAPFRPAPLATRNTMHNNQTRAWSRATRRGRGGAAGRAGAQGSRPRTSV